MQRFMKRCWAQIHLERLTQNLEHIRSLLPQGTEIMAVVKANAYGHGDDMIASELQREGIRWFCVSNIDEAISLRKSAITGEILILGMTPPELADVLVEYRLIQTVYSLEYAEQLSVELSQKGLTLECHFKIDTGMGRIGFVHHDNYDALGELLTASRLPGLDPTGIFTHYAVADEVSEDSVAYTEKQLAAFRDILAKLKENGLHMKTVHTRNSGAIELVKNEDYGFVRAGIILYGLTPSTEVIDSEIRPVMELKTVISMVKSIGAGNSISYGRKFMTDREMTIATVPVGYADGFFRSLSGHAEFLVRGKRARVIGTVCMDQLMLDVSHIPDVKMGDEVTIFGTDGDETIGAAELAQMAGTIGYETICAVGRRVPRVYYRGDEVVGVVNYLYD